MKADDNGGRRGWLAAVLWCGVSGEVSPMTPRRLGVGAAPWRVGPIC
jgi:hypothetical protein